MGNCSPTLPGKADCLATSITYSCASTLEELNCLIQTKDKVRICPGSLIDFDASSIYAPKGREITCPTNDCILRRDTTIAACPFFSVQFGEGLNLKGITFGDFQCSDIPCFPPDAQTSTQPFDNASTLQIVSFNNLNGNIDTINVDVNAESKLKQSKNSSKSKGVRRINEVKIRKNSHSRRGFHDENRKLGELGVAADHCNRDSNMYVRLFYVYDLDGNDRLDCNELTKAIGAQYTTVQCAVIFNELSDQDCFAMNGEDLIISSSSGQQVQV